MPHLDEGLLTALLDNELDPDARRAAESHLAACTECRQLLEEVRALATDADGLVGVLELPPRETPASRKPPVRRPGPVARMQWRAAAWAASLALALGLGWLASDLRYHTSHLEPRAAADTGTRETAAANQPSEPVATPSPAARDLRRTDGPAATGSAGRPAAAPPPAISVPPQAAAGASLADRQETEAKPGAAVQGHQLAEFGNASADSANAIVAAAPRPERDLVKSAAKQGSAGFRQIRMDEAVRNLGGSIRLVDGLEPERILLGPGDLVRVVYQDPPGRELWLDQERPGGAEEPKRAAPAVDGLMSGDTVRTLTGPGAQQLHWVDEHGFRLTLTGFLTADSLRAIMRHLR